MQFHAFLAKLLSMILSWLDAGNLRTRVYQLNDKLDLAKVALDDIHRIDDIGLIREIVQRTLEKL